MNQLLERRNTAYAQARSLLEGAGDEGMTAEQEQEFDRLMEEGDRLDGQLMRAQRLAALEAAVPNMVAAGGTSDPEAIRETPEYRAFNDFIRFGLVTQELQQDTEGLSTRAQGVATGSAGGFLVPQTFSDAIIRARKAFGGFRAVARNITTASGASLTYPTIDDTGNTGAWIGENTAVDPLDVVVGNLSLGAHKATTRLVRVSNELIQDNEYNLETELASLLGERLGRLESPAFINGTGTGQPTGFLAGGTVGATTAGGVTTGFGNNVQAQDFLLDLEHSVDPAYRAGASWVLNDNTLSRLRKVRDADGNAIWQPGMTAGAPSILLGYPTIIDQAMPTTAAGARFIAFGNWRESYIIRDVRELAVRRLNERFAEFDQVGFLGFTRVDGKVLTLNAYRVGANAAV
ncbi:MAG TPA: phage major capsid protein [Acidimicrobiales bacterium]|nr:phage major capsid protein [Acidimicrobiales bacterium]